MHRPHSRTHRNRLAAETSPYLLQHADNPVDWYPWGSEALERAKAEDKPILLSIGYSACHWCHVMAHESFEDAATADLMNAHFVNVKVDREERPDLDRIYQTAHQMLTQRGGGWPLTMFLSPRDQRPFFGGTYFPGEPKYGMPGFRDVLQRVADYYSKHAAEIERHGEALVQVFGELLPPPAASSLQLSRAPLEAARASLQRDFDGRFGGFGEAPKFPHPMNLEFLLRAWRATAETDQPDLQALYMATLTLTRMAEGGLYDQLGGGFCRYSVDPYWMIPHFEKMLYDNGQLLSVSAQAAVATGDPLFRRVTQETADWIRRDMEQRAGGYYSTLDADSEGHEGKFYVWRPEEVGALLDAVEYDVLVRRFGLDRDANFEGQWHLHVFKSLAQVAEESKLGEDQAAAALDSARGKLLAARNGRVWPGRDEKILTAWNGLAIAGMAAAARALDRADYLESAAHAVAFLREHCWYGERLLAVHKDGRSRFPAYLDDHAFLAWGLLELAQAQWHGPWFSWAIDLAETMLARFEDAASGGFYFTADDHEQLILRPKTFGDDATPSGNGMAARVLVRLGLLLGETRYLDAAERTLRAAWGMLEKYPHAHTSLLMALDELTAPPTIVVLRGPDEHLATWRTELDKFYDPKRFVAAIPDEAGDLPAGLAAKVPQGRAVAYVCRGMTCSAPLGTLGDLVRELRVPSRN
ncbi:MAG: thioredoxin domain-containing protein [Gammaproteobacteria bacterium]|nr:thioredoxin domain-containing protein [Gammaproteobacteria bacterium]